MGQWYNRFMYVRNPKTHEEANNSVHYKKKLYYRNSPMVEGDQQVSYCCQRNVVKTNQD
jgi:hypothetical protein